MGVRINFSSGGQRSHFADPCQVADDARMLMMQGCWWCKVADDARLLMMQGCWWCKDADDVMQIYVHETFTVSTRLHHKENASCYDSSHKNAFRLTAIARYITVIFTIGHLKIYKARCFFPQKYCYGL